MRALNGATSVANSYGQLHGVPNLVAAGGGLFPSIGAVSPTFTVLALADRTAARMIANDITRKIGDDLDNFRAHAFSNEPAE